MVSSQLPPGAPPGPPPSGSILDEVGIFRQLPPQIKMELEQRLVPRVLAAGEVLFNEGDDGDAMYIVIDGMVSVYVTDRGLGLTIDVATLGRGEAFGEMALVTGEGRAASVKAVEPTRVLCLTRDVFYKLVQAVPLMGLTIAATLAKRIDALNRTQRVAFASLRSMQIDPKAKDVLPASIVHRHRMVPISLAGGLVTLATPEPNNRVGLDEVRRILRGQEIKLIAVSEQDFNTFIVQHLPPTLAQRTASTTNQRSIPALAREMQYFGSAGTTSAEADAAQLKAVAQGAEVVELLNLILAEGIERGASDIHFEPERTTLNVRYRIDGRLQLRAGEIPIAACAPLISRIKVLAGLDISEKRLPQDGRMSLMMAKKPFDMRIATVATKYGEKVVMRVLDASGLQNDVGALILPEKLSQVVRGLFYRPNGLVLVTGPTGSGKSTTLYAALRERRSPEISICTIEDPVEYTQEGMTQVQVNEAAGLGFPEIMRTFLRQDPNLILIGETRDGVTAKLACTAALTGHLVISSFHTNDSISAVMRMRAMGVESFVIADAVLGVLNQRLVRRLCPACRVEAPPNEMTLQSLERAHVPLEPGVRFYRGQGCNQCGGDGFKGRIGVYEVLVVGPAVRDAIASDKNAGEIRAIALAEGSYVPLSRYAAFLLTEGITVPAEVLKILPKDS